MDTKHGIQELINNVCGKQHERFREECKLASDTLTKLIILIEDSTLKSVEDLYEWENPRLNITYKGLNSKGEIADIPKFPRATKGPALAKTLMRMSEKYGVEFIFCDPSKAGEKVVELLGINTE